MKNQSKKKYTYAQIGGFRDTNNEYGPKIKRIRELTKERYDLDLYTVSDVLRYCINQTEKNLTQR